MSSRRPRKKATPRQRSHSTRRKPPRKRKKKTTRSRARSRRTGTKWKRKTAGGHSPLFLLFFWPYLIINRLVRNWPTLLRIPAKGISYSACTGATVLILGGLSYFLRSLRYDMSKVAEMPQRSIIYDRNMKELGPPKGPIWTNLGGILIRKLRGI